MESSSEVVHNIIIVIDAPLRIFVPGINLGSVHSHFIEYFKANTKISTAIRKGHKIKTMNEVKFSDITKFVLFGKQHTISEKWFINNINN